MVDKPEKIILKEVALEASRLGMRLFRNHVGGFYATDGSYNRTGLCKGSSDFIGWYKGRFTAIECKTSKGILSKEQQNFIDQVNAAGGIGIVCRDAKNLKKQLDEFL